MTIRGVGALAAVVCCASACSPEVARPGEWQEAAIFGGTGNCLPPASELQLVAQMSGPLRNAFSVYTAPDGKTLLTMFDVGFDQFDTSDWTNPNHDSFADAVLYFEAKVCEYLMPPDGDCVLVTRETFKHDGTAFVTDSAGHLILDEEGRHFPLNPLGSDSIEYEGLPVKAFKGSLDVIGKLGLSITSTPMPLDSLSPSLLSAFRNYSLSMVQDWRWNGTPLVVTNVFSADGRQSVAPGSQIVSFMWNEGAYGYLETAAGLEAFAFTGNGSELVDGLHPGYTRLISNATPQTPLSSEPQGPPPVSAPGLNLVRAHAMPLAGGGHFGPVNGTQASQKGHNVTMLAGRLGFDKPLYSFPRPAVCNSTCGGITPPPPVDGGVSGPPPPTKYGPSDLGVAPATLLAGATDNGLSSTGGCTQKCTAGPCTSGHSDSTGTVTLEWHYDSDGECVAPKTAADCAVWGTDSERIATTDADGKDVVTCVRQPSCFATNTSSSTLTLQMTQLDDFLAKQASWQSTHSDADATAFIAARQTLWPTIDGHPDTSRYVPSIAVTCTIDTLSASPEKRARIFAEYGERATLDVNMISRTPEYMDAAGERILGLTTVDTNPDSRCGFPDARDPNSP